MYLDTMRLGRFVLVAVICSAQLGCSVAFVKSPPPPEIRRQDTHAAIADCTETKILPILDTVAASIAGAFVLVAVGTLTGTPAPNTTAQQTNQNDTLRVEAFWGGLLGSGLTLASAIWGYRTTRQCREYVEERRRRNDPWPSPAAP
jgi:hypothetical protein